MVSERATRANRKNAQSSTGPRTAAGKARSRQNARKHGLSAVDPNPDIEVEISALAVLIAGEHDSDPVILRAAQAVAEAQMHLQRIRSFRLSLMRSKDLPEGIGSERNQLFSVKIEIDLLRQLETLIRYERRALSRRKSAARQLNQLIRAASMAAADRID